MTTTANDARQLIASNVRAMLGRKKSTGTALANALGKSQAAASRRLNGETAFDTDELLMICEHYRVPLSDLIEGITADEEGRPQIYVSQSSVQLALLDFSAWPAPVQTGPTVELAHAS